MLQSGLALVGLSSILARVAAHQGCGGQEIARRNLGMINGAAGFPNIQRRYVNNGTTDVNAECSYYTYQPAVDAKSQFPTIWDIAGLVPGDTDAQTLFNQVVAQVNSTVPNVQVKGTPNGDFSAFTPTYNTNDPDCWWTYRQCDTPKRSGIPADIVDIPEPRSLGYGFDDGPNCSHNAFYEFLRENKQKATMFYIGSNVMDWPLQAQDAITDGHEICIHTWSHNYMTALTNEQAFAELYYTRKAIKLITGVTPMCWRPPFGDVDDRIRVIAGAMNLTSILWQEDSEDWRINTGNPPVTAASIDGNYQALIDSLNNGTFNERGTIMLTHELNNFTMSEAIKWYPQLKQAFASLVPVASAYNLTHPYQESNISYPDFGGNIASSSSSSASATGSMSGSMTNSRATGAATGAMTTGATTAHAAQTAGLKSGSSVVTVSFTAAVMGGMLAIYSCM